MIIILKKTSYLQAIKESKILSSDEKIFNRTKVLEFQYGDVTQQEFDAKYSAEGWFGRKVVAFPAASWSGCIKTIYHLAQAILELPTAFFDSGQCLKARFFCVVRDFQESYGWLTSFFNDRYGQFHVQESQFQETCYKSLIRNVKNPASRYVRAKLEYGQWVDPDAHTISLLDYKEATPKERGKLLQRFQRIQKFPINPFNLLNLNITLAKFVDQSDEELLKMLTLADFSIPFENSRLRFAVLNEEEFLALTIEDLQKGVNPDQFCFIKQRLEKLAKQEENDQQQEAIEDYSVVKTTLKDFRMSASDVAKHQKTIPDIAFRLFTNDQIKNLILSEMQNSQIEALFFALNEFEIKERLALFNPQDVVDAIHQSLFPTGNLLKLLSDEHVRRLDLAQLSKDQVDAIFCWKENSTQDAACFAFFDVDQVRNAIEKGILTTAYQFNLLSDQQLGGLQLSTLSSDIIHEMFRWSSDNTAARKRFAHFQVSEVQNAIEKGILTTEYQFNLLSDQQLGGLQLSTLSSDIIHEMFRWSSDNTAARKRFAHFQVSEVRKAIEKRILTKEYQFNLLSDQQLGGLQLSKLSSDIINKMFRWSIDNTAARKRFAHFQVSEVQAALSSGKLNKYQVTLISIEQLQGIHFPTISQAVVNLIFPPYSVDHLREEHSYWGTLFKTSNKGVSEDKRGKICRYSQEELQKMSNAQKENNEELLSQLSEEQREHLKPRLYCPRQNLS